MSRHTTVLKLRVDVETISRRINPMGVAWLNSGTRTNNHRGEPGTVAPLWNLEMMTSYAVSVQNNLRFSFAPSALASNTITSSLKRRKSCDNFRSARQKGCHFRQSTRFCPPLAKFLRAPMRITKWTFGKGWTRNNYLCYEVWRTLYVIHRTSKAKIGNFSLKSDMLMTSLLYKLFYSARTFYWYQNRQ